MSRWFRWAANVLLGRNYDYTGSTLTASTFALTANGSATTTLTTTLYKNGALASGETVEYTVSRITLDEYTALFLSADPSNIAADGLESTEASLQLLYDLDGELIPLPGVAGSQVVLAVSGTNNTITQPTGVSDADGIISGSVVTTQAGATKVVTATVAGVAQSRSVSFTTDAGAPGATIFDTRAGQAQSIQGAASIAAAESASGLDSMRKYYPSFVWENLGWSTDIDGSGTRAFRAEILQNAGNSVCVAGGDSQMNFVMARYLNGAGANGDTLVVEYKVRLGKSATGGGIGTQDAYTDGGKKLVITRFPTTLGTQGRITAATVAGLQQTFQMDAITAESGTGTANDPRSVNSSDIRNAPATGISIPTEGAYVDWSDYAGQTVTIRYEITTETTSGADDGAFVWKLNNEVLFNLSSVRMGTAGWAWLEIGGPTWICPPHDMTLYYYDIRAFIQ